MFMHISALPGQPVPLGMRQRKKERKKQKGEDIQSDQLHATGGLTPVVSLCIEEGGWPRIKIIGGTWVCGAHDVGAGSVVVVKTLRQRGHFGFWPSESGGP